MRGFMEHLPVIGSKCLELVEGPRSSDDNGLPLDKLSCKIIATAPAICWIVSAGGLRLREAGISKLIAVETGGTTAVSAVLAGGGGVGGTMSLALDIVQPAAINNRKRESSKLELRSE